MLPSQIYNDCLHFWINNPRATILDTIQMLMVEGYMESPQLTKYLHSEKCKFNERNTQTFDMLNSEVEPHPIGSNPYMTFEKDIYGT